MGFTMFSSIRKSLPDATTRLCSTGCKVGQFYGFYRTALTHALKIAVFIFWQLLDYSEPPKDRPLVNGFN